MKEKYMKKEETDEKKISTVAPEALELKWSSTSPIDMSRIGHMYCFKNCSVNSN